MSLRAVVGAWRRSAVVALLSAALAAGAAWTAQGWRKDAAIARQAAAFALERDRQAQATVAALEAVREEGRRRTAAVEKARDDAQELPPLRPLMLLALVLSVTGCAPTQTRWLAPQSPEIPMLPMEARQGQRHRSACLHAQQG